MGAGKTRRVSFGRSSCYPAWEELIKKRCAPYRPGSLLLRNFLMLPGMAVGLILWLRHFIHSKPAFNSSALAFCLYLLLKESILPPFHFICRKLYTSSFDWSCKCFASSKCGGRRYPKEWERRRQEDKEAQAALKATNGIKLNYWARSRPHTSRPPRDGLPVCTDDPPASL